MNLAADWERLRWILGALFAFGALYNLLVGWMQENGYDEGYTSFLVVVGVGATVAAYAAIDLTAAFEFFLMFVASGCWMIVGDVWRHMKARKHSEDLARRK